MLWLQPTKIIQETLIIVKLLRFLFCDWKELASFTNTAMKARGCLCEYKVRKTIRYDMFHDTNHVFNASTFFRDSDWDWLQDIVSLLGLYGYVTGIPWIKLVNFFLLTNHTDTFKQLSILYYETLMRISAVMSRIWVMFCGNIIHHLWVSIFESHTTRWKYINYDYSCPHLVPVFIWIFMFQICLNIYQI